MMLNPEFFWAVITFEGSFPSVHSSMNSHGTYISEFLVAVLAFKRGRRHHSNSSIMIISVIFYRSLIKFSEPFIHIRDVTATDPD